MSAGRCVCGCGRRSVQKHHVVYVQEIRRRMGASKRLDRAGRRRLDEAMGDSRNLVPMAHECHSAHHSRARTLPLRVLPDSVFVFAVELMGAGAAFEYLARRYSGRDERLEALLSAASG